MITREILIIDDDENLCRLLKDRIEMDKRFRVFTAQTAKEGMAVVSDKNISVIFLDVQLPDENGLDTLKKMKEHDPEIIVIMITAHGSIHLAVESLQMGAAHFLAKPFPFEQSIQLIDRFIEKQKLVRERFLMREDLPPSLFVGGKSAATRKLFRLVKQVAPTNSTVLISGPSGTGKEIIARMIYHKSQRSEKPFVKIDCTLLSSTILESDLFGHEKGAFTGATKLKRGRVELADGGTIFFDEIGDLPLELQAKLLRVIQYGEFERVGGTKTLKTDLRVLAATNRNLRQLVEEGKFREDLYYRLNVIQLEIPPLRERVEEIPDLISHFIKKYSSELKKNISHISPGVLKRLQQHHWPGNVRELENMIERAIVFATGTVLDSVHFPADIMQTPRAGVAISGVKYKDAVAQFKRNFLVETLKQFNGDVTRTANQIGLPRTYLYQLFKELKIDIRGLKSKEK